MLLRLLPRLGAASLVLAPRHLERVAEVLALVRSSGFVPVTLGGTGTGQVLVVDAFGKLEALYRAADVVVMGGTFAPHGGHNMLEPARWGKPVVLGPSIDNFRDIALGLLARQAAVRVGGEQELEVALRALLEDAGRRGAVGERALAVWRDGRGATERYVRAIVKALEKERSDDG
jgi:3-deoxy-D-manno-octulosonic-acid transferase